MLTIQNSQSLPSLRRSNMLQVPGVIGLITAWYYRWRTALIASKYCIHSMNLSIFFIIHVDMTAGKRMVWTPIGWMLYLAARSWRCTTHLSRSNRLVCKRWYVQCKNKRLWPGITRDISYHTAWTIGKLQDCLWIKGDWCGEDERGVDNRSINFKWCEDKGIKTEYPKCGNKMQCVYY